MCFFRVNFWSSILFLWSGHVSRFLWTPFNFLLWCGHLKKQPSLSVLRPDLVQGNLCQAGGSRPLKPFLVFSFPQGLPAKFTVLRCRGPHLFSSVSKLPPVLSVLQVRNQSLGQPRDKPEHWMPGPFFCLHPEGGAPRWSVSFWLLHYTA